MPRVSLQVAIILTLLAALAACGGTGGSAGGPAITSISPNTVTAGGSAFTLTVAGSGFSGAVITWNGQALATTIVSGTNLKAQVPASLIVAPGSVAIAVVNLPFGASVKSNTMNLTIGQPSALAIRKAHAGNFVQGQIGAHYTITVVNGASAGATSGAVSVTDALPAGLSATGIGGAGWTCDLASLTCTRSDALPPGSSYAPITVTVNVAPAAPASVTNTANLSGGGAPSSSATDVTTINPPAVPALTVSKRHNGNFSQGQNGATYAITVTNSGSGAASGAVSVTDTLPAGLGAAGMAGAGWTCNTTTLTCTRADALAPGSSYPPITLTVNVSPTAPSSVVNSVTVSGGGSASSSATDPTTITPPPPPPPPAAKPNLSIAKSHVGSFAVGQIGATYTIMVTNGGNGDTSGPVTVTDALPSGLTATGITGTGWTCDPNTLTCIRTDVLPASSSYPAITLTVNVTATSATTVTNSATVSGGGSAHATASDLTDITGP